MKHAVSMAEKIYVNEKAQRGNYIDFRRINRYTTGVYAMISHRGKGVVFCAMKQAS